MEANTSTWNQLLNIYINKSDKKVLKYLACTENPDIIINFFDMSTSNNSIIQDEDYYRIYSEIIYKHAKNNKITDYVLANLNKIVSRNYDVNDILDDIIFNVYSNEQLDKISTFVKNKFEEKVFKDIQNKIKHRKIQLLDIFASFRSPIIQE
ncbi:hypothetical protein ACFW04_001724 [Cataglyphis niger]